MRRRMRKFLLAVVVPVLVVACAEPNAPNEIDTPIGSESAADDEHEQEEAPPARAITAALDIRTVDCFRGTVLFAVKASFTDNGEATDAVSCRVTFDDGTVVNDCGGFHEFGAGGAEHVVSVEVRSMIDGSVIELSQEVFVYGPPVGTVTASACNFDLSYKVEADPALLVHAFVEPHFDTLEPEYYLKRENTVRVPAAGDYRIWVFLQDERGGFNCVSSTEALVHVDGCTCGH
jgi:hypothetical protein